MKIYIPSRARPDRQITADHLRRARIPFTIVRTPTDTTEYDRNLYPQMVGLPWVVDIASKRNFIMEWTSRSTDKKILVLDDDLTFHRVLSGKTRPAEDWQIREMIDKLDHHLDKFAHVGVAKRYMIQNQPQPYVVNGKPKSVLGYNLDLFPSPIPRFRLKSMSDIDYTMQLIASGRSCLVLTEYCYAEGDYMAPGGCSEWRTKQMIHECTLEVADRWPGYVSVRGGPDEESGTLASFRLKKLAKDHDARPTTVTEPQ